MRQVILIVAAAVAVGCSTSKGGATSAGKPADYCPGCSAFCGAECPKTDAGACKACGKTPVKSSACSLTWFWCAKHTDWHADSACADAAYERCCTASKPATAMCVPRDAKGLEKATYCPACGCFCGAECPVEKGVCKKCGKRPVEATVLASTWYGCAEHRAWHEGAPCGENATKKCCAETKRRVLACHPN